MDLDALRRSVYLTQAAVESPVALIIVRAGTRANASTVSFFSEVAHHPTSLWISIDRASYTHSLLEESGQFTLVTLARTQASIAAACGTSSGRDRDKCKDLSLYENGGYLFLDGAIASTACRVVQTHPLQTHTLFIAHILHGDMRRARVPLQNLLVSHLRAL